MGSSFYRRHGKRLVDLAAAFPLLIISAPLLGVTALFLFIANPGPVLFFQRRPGKDGKLFTLWKFRTMSEARGPDGALLPDEQRLTSSGALVRKLSLDEMLQLVNVLKGEMSLVGPRPLLPEYLPLYSPFQSRRHEVLPGITGLAQISGRNSLSWDEKFALDVSYVDQLSLALDIRILFSTALHVLRPRGISADGAATMPRFTGSAVEPCVRSKGPSTSEKRPLSGDCL